MFDNNADIDVSYLKDISNVSFHEADIYNPKMKEVISVLCFYLRTEKNVVNKLYYYPAKKC